MNDAVNRRRQIVDFVLRFIADNGCAPTLREIAKGVGLNAHTTVRHHLEILRDKEFVTFVDGRVGSLKILRALEMEDV